MSIACQSRLTATNPVQVPGSIQFRLTLQAGLRSTTALITFVINDPTTCVHFTNGSKMEQVRAKVSTAGTVVVHNTQLAGLKGRQVSTLGLDARVEEDGTFQCSQQTTVAVSQCNCMQVEGVVGERAEELEEVVATLVTPGGTRKAGARKGAAKKGGRTGNRGR